MGYLPEAMRNYLMRLGWAHGDDEIIDTAQAVAWFDLEGIGQSAARFDFEKLNFVNAHYMKLADNDRLTDLTMAILQKQGHALAIDAQKHILKNMDELKSRAKNLVQLADDARIYWLNGVDYDFDEKAIKNLDADGRKNLQNLAENLQNLTDWSTPAIETLCKSMADALAGGKLGKVMMPLRAALTGRAASPSLTHAMETLGKDIVLSRLSYTLGKEFT